MRKQSMKTWKWYIICEKYEAYGNERNDYFINHQWRKAGVMAIDVKWWPRKWLAAAEYAACGFTAIRGGNLSAKLSAPGVIRRIVSGIG